MSTPLYGSLYVDVPATGVAVRRIQSDMRFVATRMVPKLNVLKPSGLYPVIVSGDLNRDEMEQRGPTAPPAKAGWRRTQNRFSTDARSLEYDLNDAEAAASDVETNPEIAIPRTLGYKALLHMERRMALKFFVDGAWFRKVTGANADNPGTDAAKNRLYFDDAAADPITALTEEIMILGRLAGADPSEMGLTFGARLWQKIRNHAKVKAQVVGIAGGPIGAALVAQSKPAELPQLAALLGIKWCAVSTAIYNSAAWTNDPAAAAVNTYIVPQDDALLYVNRLAGEDEADALMSPDFDQPSAFCRPVWTKMAQNGVQVRRVRDEKAGPSGSWASIIDVYNGFEVVTPEAAIRLAGMVTP